MAVGLAQPPLVGRAGGAQLADRAPPTAREKDVRLLAAQQPALAHITRDVGL